MRQENRLRKLESSIKRKEQETPGGYDWRMFAALPQEEIARLHAEHVENKALAPDQVEYRERLRHMTPEQLMQEHYANL